MERDGVVTNESADKPAPKEEARGLPPGNSAVEIAAREGFGPLSPAGAGVWHGDSRPCPSCGQLARRSVGECDACGEDLSEDMLQKMRAFAGPWYVHEHVRPFPGVTGERLIRQVRRGVLTATTIVRGPTTDHQWRYAAETPGLCTYLGVCWSCQSKVPSGATKCDSCGVELGELSDGAAVVDLPEPSQPATDDGDGELAALGAAVESMHRPVNYEDDVPRLGFFRASWIAVALVTFLVGALFIIIQRRDTSLREKPTAQSPTPAATAVQPTPHDRAENNVDHDDN